MKRNILAAAMLLALTLSPGCGDFGLLKMLGYPGHFVLRSNDYLAVPGEAVALRAELTRGKFMRDQQGVTVTFLRDGQPYGQAVTDEEGRCQVPFTPTAPGDYHFTVECLGENDQQKEPVQVSVLIACREPNAPLCIADIDQTLTEPHSLRRKVLTGDPQPASGSQAVMQKLAAKYTIVYLTERPEYVWKKTKAWLQEHGYPPGPVYVTGGGMKALLQGNLAYKQEALAAIRQRFKGPAIGIGDQITDQQAYARTWVHGFMMMHMPDAPSAKALRALADDLETLPPATQVVNDWMELDAALNDGASHDRPTAQANLRKLAKEME